MNYLLIIALLVVMCFCAYCYANCITRQRFTKLLILIVGSFLFTGCLTVKKIERNCDKFAQVCIADSKTETIIKTVYRDTVIIVSDTVTVSLPSDTVTITDTVVIKNGLCFLPWRHFEQGLIAMDIAVQYSRITASAYLVDSTILFPIRDTITLEKVIKEQNTDTHTANTVTVVEKYIPKFYKFTFWFFMVVVLAASLWVISRIYQAKFTALIKTFKL